MKLNITGLLDTSQRPPPLGWHALSPLSSADFRWLPDHIPMASWELATALPVAYLVFSIVCNMTRARRTAVSMTAISVLHNAALIVFSAVVFVGMMVETSNEFARVGFRGFFCPQREHHKHANSGRLFWWAYLFYLSKYYEYADTVLLAARNKRIIPLHIWHHATMVPAMWLCFKGELVVSLWGLAQFNSLVHVVMYTYYLASIISPGSSTLRGIKKTITILQLAQFVLGVCGGVWFSTMYFTDLKLWHGAPLVEETPEGALPMSWTWEGLGVGFSWRAGCIGDAGALGLTMLVNMSFLLLFTRFFKDTYTAPEKRD